MPDTMYDLFVQIFSEAYQAHDSKENRSVPSDVLWHTPADSREFPTGQ